MGMKPRMKAYELNSMPSHGRFLAVSHQGMASAARVAPDATASPDTLQITAHSGMKASGAATHRRPGDTPKTFRTAALTP